MPWTIAPELRASANFISTHFLRSQLPVMAAALAYRTIFGMIPVIVIGLVVLGAFASDEQVADTVRKFLNYTGVAGISISEPRWAHRSRPTRRRPSPRRWEAGRR